MLTRSLFHPLFVADETKQQSAVFRASTAFLAFALFFAQEIPQAGTTIQAGSTIQAVEDSARDIAFADIVTRFRERLPKEHRSDAYRLAKLLLDLSDRYMVSPGLLLSVIETESGFRANAVSKAGAVGLMQLLPGTAREVAKSFGVRYSGSQDLFDPAVNMRLGVAYISYLRGRFGHSVHYLAAYNMGPSALRNRITKGDFNLGAVEAYVRKIQERTINLRGRFTSGGSASRSFLRAQRLASPAL